jgi:hypothetical protein
MTPKEITDCTIKPLDPSYMLHFQKEGKDVGWFDFKEGKMHFEGELTESGQIFVDWVIEAFKQRLEDAVKAEREACAKVCEQSDDEGEGPDSWGWHSKDSAAAIRARGQA